MTARLVVSDTSPIRVLWHISQLPLLAEFFDEVLIPPAVARELESPPSHAVPILLAAIPKCRVEAPKDVVATKELEAELQTGEAEAIVLAPELGAELLIDERAGGAIVARYAAFILLQKGLHYYRHCIDRCWILQIRKLRAEAHATRLHPTPTKRTPGTTRRRAPIRAEFRGMIGAR